MSTITVHELNQLLQHGVHQNSLVIDVRTPAEYQTSRIAAVVNRPLDQLEHYVPEFQSFISIVRAAVGAKKLVRSCANWAYITTSTWLAASALGNKLAYPP
jgi:rhodanese-related sulfurtransferase